MISVPTSLYGEVVVLCVVVLWVVVPPVDMDVSVELDIEVSAGGDVCVLSTVVEDSVVVVLWPQAASPTRQATADAARIDFNMRFSKESALKSLGTDAAVSPLFATTSLNPVGSRLGFAKLAFRACAVP